MEPYECNRCSTPTGMLSVAGEEKQQILEKVRVPNGFWNAAHSFDCAAILY